MDKIPSIVIEVDRGSVQHIHSDLPVRVHIIDYDVQTTEQLDVNNVSLSKIEEVLAKEEYSDGYLADKD